MKKLANIIAAAALATTVAFAGTANASELTLAVTAGPVDENAVAPLALYMANDYTVFTRALDDVIDRNAAVVLSTTSSDTARTAISDLLAAGAENDAAAAAESGYPEQAAYASTQSSGYSAPAALGPRTISMAGSVIPYVDSFRSAAAPESGAGLWLGSDSTTDGSFGYFIGHNPGDFSCMLSMGIGSQITVTDADGAARTYTVIDQFDVANTTTWKSIESRVATHGESIVVQCCIQGGAYYRIMVAA